MRRRTQRLCRTVWLIILAFGSAGAAQPQLHTHPHLQSPVRGEPDDLLLIPGYGFESDVVVAYQALTTATPQPPTNVPGTPTIDEGFAEIVRVAVPDNVVVRLPSVMEKDRAYALWVQNPEPGAQWQGPILINDARPLWISPDVTYATQTPAGLPRELKVVGRSLQPAPTKVTQVRLSGISTYVLDAIDDRDPETAIEHYVARVSLPASMDIDSYTVEVSRGDDRWMPVEGQVLQVLPDPGPPGQVTPVGDPCFPDDGVDDTGCIEAAIAASGPGDQVYLGPGVWDLRSAPSSNGIIVATGVDLVGAGASMTRIVRHPSWTATPVFSLNGNQTVTGIHFDEENADLTVRKHIFRLGVPDSTEDPATVENLVFTNNRFTNMVVGINGGGHPIRHLFIAYNEFEAIKNALYLGHYTFGNDFLRFQIRDSVVAYNLFLPNKVDPEFGYGNLASNLGAAERLDFSNNVADGTLNGWRAAFFWTTFNNQEMLLISQNFMTCTGDRGGDGEGIGLDFNRNEPGFVQMLPVASQDPTEPGKIFRVVGEWLGGDETAFNQHWVQIVSGPGLGQSRKIARTSTSGLDIEIEVEPPFDVPPVPGSSKITVYRQYWQTYIVDNVIDNRTELGCTNPLSYQPSADRDRPRAGMIVLWDVTADSAIEGNLQKNTSGIIFTAASAVEGSPPGHATLTRLQYFTEIRNNRVVGEAFTSGVEQDSGIQLRYGASPDYPAAVLGYGVSISHNSILDADSQVEDFEVAISLCRCRWLDRIEDQRKSPLVFRNTIRNAPTAIYFGNRVADAVTAGNLVQSYDTCIIQQTGGGSYFAFDIDADGVDRCDNCPLISNTNQTDADNDDIGDACDNCPSDSNPGQENQDVDSLGDACDPDDDNDGVGDASDNCPLAPNPGQEDLDNDGVGDDCDNCVADFNALQSDLDGDSVGDICDPCPLDFLDDRDGDGLCCPDDNCCKEYNPDQLDTDGDGTGDPCDACPSGPGVQLFFDEFSAGLDQWTESGDGDWNTESLHSSSGYPGTGSGSPAAHSDNCDSSCAIDFATSLDLTGYDGATLSFLRFVDSSLDNGEYLRFLAWNGSSWDLLRDWTHGAGDTNTWHLETVDLVSYLGISDFAVRVETRSGSPNEHVHVDDVRVCATLPPLGCTVDTDCDDDVGCTDDSCDVATGNCVYTPDDALCDDGQFCNGAESCDTMLDCQAGSDPCPGELCQEGADICVGCLADADCDDGAYCNGAETCVAEICQSGTPVGCDDGVGCTDDSCNEATDSCDNVANDGLCADGSFCNGAEICDPVLDCQSGAPVNCDDGVTCTVDGCNEVTDGCDNMANDAICLDSGLFCDGTESCDPVLDCVSSGDPCGSNETCNETTDTCDSLACGLRNDLCSTNLDCCSGTCKRNGRCR